jgi:hypothetical protein
VAVLLALLFPLGLALGGLRDVFFAVVFEVVEIFLGLGGMR